MNRAGSILLVALLPTVACKGAPDGLPPVARLAVEPEVIPEGDSFSTEILADSSESYDALGGALEFSWDFDPPVRILERGPADSWVRFSTAGDRPTSVRVTVWAADRWSRVEHRISLTLAGPDS